MKHILIILALLISGANAEETKQNTPTAIECKKILALGDKEEIQRSGCCSHHGGACGCTYTGEVECCDGSTSPSCGCRSGDGGLRG